LKDKHITVFRKYENNKCPEKGKNISSRRKVSGWIYLIQE
jgi:hypothetical protein